MRKFRLQDMSTAEFAERMSEDPVILLPFGAQETQGPHVPMGDFVLANALAERVAARADCVMAPTIPIGESEFFRAMPGCISLRPQTLAQVVIEMCENFFDHGLDRLILFNGQTSNAAAFDMATRALRRSHGIYVPTLNLWRILTQEQLKALYGDNLAGSQGHGGDPITSMFLHLFPDLVAKDRITGPNTFKSVMGLKTRSPVSVDFKGVPVPMPFNITELSANGNLSGDGRKASAEIGQGTADHIVDFAVAFVEHFAKTDPRTLEIK